MAFFSRRKNSGSDAPDAESTEPREEAAPAADPEATGSAASVPEVNISVQSFRGVGAQAGPEVPLPEKASAPPQTVPAERPLPLSPIAPPAQTQTVKGMNDNVLLRETLARLGEAPANEHMIGVLRQLLQGHLILHVHGDAQEQLAQGKPLSLSILRDGERRFLLAFSSARALAKAVQQQGPASEKASAVAQSVVAVLNQVIASDLDGLILDNASAPHRAVFPVEVLKKALEQADPQLALKSILAVPHASGAEAPVASAIADSRLWVAGGERDGQIGVAEMRSPDGARYLQLFSHPLEVVALGREERPLPFNAEQLGKVLLADSELAGVVVDPAGPSVVVRREALGEVIAKAP